MSNDVEIKLYQEYGPTGTPVINLTQCSSDELSRMYGTIGGGISVPGPAIRWHSANGVAPQQVDFTPQNRTAVYRLIAKPSNTLTADQGDAINDEIIEARQLLNIAERRLEDDTSRILLSVRRKNSTNTTVHEVISGVVDDELAHYDEGGSINDIAMKVYLRLTLRPYGETGYSTDYGILVTNILNADPTFTLDADGDGLADGWTGVNLASKSISNWGWVGGTAQHFTGDGTGAPYIVSAWTTVHAGSNLHASILVKNPAAGESCILRLQTYDGSTYDNSDTTVYHDDSTSAADKTYNDGVTDWYLISVLHGNPSATMARLIIPLYGNNSGSIDFDRAMLWET